MAVTRFKLPASEFRVMAAMMEPVHPRAARELARAALRPGLTAELTEHEFPMLYNLAPWSTPVAEALDAAAVALEVAVAEERSRLRGPALGMAPHRSYHARQTKRSTS